MRVTDASTPLNRYGAIDKLLKKGYFEIKKTTMGPALALPKFFSTLSVGVSNEIAAALSCCQIKKILKKNNLHKISGHFQTYDNAAVRRHHMAKMIMQRMETIKTIP